ncbi:MAG: DUF1289 domain-containing protein [Gammaproteobacteria bacterium]|nr:MAG: DUF1289 domain-containing protein [Gammaproteobacteria bacterium]
MSTQTAITSPCTGICTLDETTGWCLGCARSRDEIAGWRKESDSWREAVWAELPERLAQLGVAGQRLPWTTDDTRRFVAESLGRGTGTWVMGVVGAVAEFAPAPGEAVSVTVEDDTVTAHTRGGALRMIINDDVRALTFDQPTDDGKARSRIAIAVKRKKRQLPVALGVTDLGEDREALIARDSGHLFDLGLGREESRFCVRVAAGRARTALENVADRPFAEALPAFGSELLADSPTRVVETVLGRIEVQGAIPHPDERSPDGPHTHLLPNQLATELATPVDMPLPDPYLPGALFYPA